MIHIKRIKKYNKSALANLELYENIYVCTISINIEDVLYYF